MEHSYQMTAPSLRTLVWAHLMPLTHRLERGEGLLYPVALSLVVGVSPAPRLIAQALVALVALGLLYFVNDLSDCHRDLNDPGKNRDLTTYLVRHRPTLVRLVLAEHVLLVLVAYVAIGWRSAVAVAAVTVVNLIYSAALKGTPVVDAPWVALWGGLYLLVIAPEDPLSLIAVPAVMTAVMHAHQVLRDREIDRINAVGTSAVTRRWLPSLQIALACVAMVVLVSHHRGPWLGASAVIPFVLHATLRSNQVAWFASRAYFAVIWLVLLGDARELF